MSDVINLVAAAGGGGVIAAVVNALFNKRKLSAEATEIITKAAAGTVALAVSDNTALRAEIAELRARVDLLAETARIHEQRERAWQQHEERYRWHLERWSRYANALLTLLNASKIKVAEEMPSLYPDLRQ
jgi:hypothetical protein